MAVFVRTQLSGVWTTGNYVPPVSDWSHLAQKALRSINGTTGGFWAPRYVSLVFSNNFFATPITKVDYGGTIETANTARFKLGNNEWPKLGISHVGRTRKIVTSTVRAMGRLVPDLEIFDGSVYGWIFNPQYHAIQSIACTLQHTITDWQVPTLHQPTFTLSLRVHDASRLTKATLWFRVPIPRDEVPQALPRVRIVRSDDEGNLVPLQSTTNGADSDGWIAIASPTTGGAWYSNGEAQSFEYICDQNNTIDVSQYSYFLEIEEEVGTIEAIGISQCDGSIVRPIHRVVRIKHQASINGTPSPSMLDNDRIFLPKSTFRSGIWLVDNVGSTWLRAKVLKDSSQFIPYTIVYGPNNDLSDVIQRYELMAPNQDTATSIAQNVSATEFDSTLIYFSAGFTIGDPSTTAMGLTPRGNIYHSVVCEFDSIVDMRPQ